MLKKTSSVDRIWHGSRERHGNNFITCPNCDTEPFERAPRGSLYFQGNCSECAHKNYWFITERVFCAYSKYETLPPYHPHPEEDDRHAVIGYVAPSMHVMAWLAMDHEDDKIFMRGGNGVIYETKEAFEERVRAHAVEKAYELEAEMALEALASRNKEGR